MIRFSPLPIFHCTRLGGGSLAGHPCCFPALAFMPCVSLTSPPSPSPRVRALASPLLTADPTSSAVGVDRTLRRLADQMTSHLASAASVAGVLALDHDAPAAEWSVHAAAWELEHRGYVEAERVALQVCGVRA